MEYIKGMNIVDKKIFEKLEVAEDRVLIDGNFKPSEYDTGDSEDI